MITYISGLTLEEQLNTWENSSNAEEYRLAKYLISFHDKLSEDSYNSCYDDSKELGCEKGYNKGYDQGYSDGYSDGNSNGYQEAYKEVYTIGSEWDLGLYDNIYASYDLAYNALEEAFKEIVEDPEEGFYLSDAFKARLVDIIEKEVITE